jgi:outer membrane protein
MPDKSKYYICALGFGLNLILSAFVFGQAGAAASAAGAAIAGVPPIATRIGIVNIQAAIINTNEGKKEFSALQARFAPKQNSLKSLNNEVESMKRDLQAKGDKLNEDERAKQAKNLEAKQKTLQRDYEDAQNKFQQAEQEVVNRMGGKMLTVLEKYAKNNGYAIILDVSNPQTPVIWASQETNVTKEQVDAYNTEAPVADAPANPAPKPAGTTANPTPAGTATAPKKP